MNDEQRKTKGLNAEQRRSRAEEDKDLNARGLQSAERRSRMREG